MVLFIIIVKIIYIYIFIYIIYLIENIDINLLIKINEFVV